MSARPIEGGGINLRAAMDKGLRALRTFSSSFEGSNRLGRAFIAQDSNIGRLKTRMPAFTRADSGRLPGTIGRNRTIIASNPNTAAFSPSISQ